jgi:hypothetical protein
VEAHATEAAGIFASPSQILSSLVEALGSDQVAELLALVDVSGQPAANPTQASDAAQPSPQTAMTTQVSVSGRLVQELRASASASAPRLLLPAAWLPEQLRKEATK